MSSNETSKAETSASFSRARPELGVRPLYLLASVLSFIFWSYASYRFSSDPLPTDLTRLNATTDLWRHAPFPRHWFLFFLTPDDAAKGIPYGNMPFFLGIFYVAYNSILNFLTFGRFPFATTYFVTVCAIFGAFWFVLQPVLAKSTFLRGFLIIFLTSGVVMTSPYLHAFIKVQHDQPYVMFAASVTILAFAMYRGGESIRSPIVWAALAMSSISHFVGLVSLVCCFLARRQFQLKAWIWISLLGISILNILIPVVFAKLAFGQTSASSLLFRTGLDGSTQYLTSHWQAIFRPTAARSIVRELGMKLLVGTIWVGIGWQYLKHDIYPGLIKAVGIACIPYAVHWAIFPQAIAIHPYLYDLLFLVPIELGLAMLLGFILLRVKELTHGFTVAVAVGAAALLIEDNLLQLAQGKMIGYDF